MGNAVIDAPMKGYSLFVLGSGLVLLVLAATLNPGCSGPATDKPCDYLAKFKQGASTAGGYARYAEIEVLDQGSAVYVLQRTSDPNIILHTQGVLIDKKSCRICEVNGRHSAHRITLATYPAEIAAPK